MENPVEKPPCEQCGSAAHVVRVIIGMPSEQGEETVARGEAVLHGCIPMPNMARWHCKSCKRDLDAGRGYSEDLFL